MKYYAIAEINVTDPAWVRDYLQNVTAMVEQAGGRFLARTPKIERIEGERDTPQTLVIIEFPSREAFIAFYDSAAYQPYKQSRLAGSMGSYFLIAGEDFATH